MSLKSLPVATVGEVRNFGAQEADSEYLAFIDSDCVVDELHFLRALKLLDNNDDLGAVGCKVGLPPDPGWIESTWHALHFPRGDRFVDYINSGNLLVRRCAFEGVGGFTGELVSGEDAELGQKLRSAGWKLFETPDLEVAHLGNPKNLGQFWNREVWHGMGMFGTVSIKEIDKPTVAMAFHGIFLVAAVLIWAIAIRERSNQYFALGVLASLAIPTLAVLFRASKARSVKTPLLRGVLLYQIYFLARLRALAQVVTNRVREALLLNGPTEPKGP